MSDESGRGPGDQEPKAAGNEGQARAPAALSSGHAPSVDLDVPSGGVAPPSAAEPAMAASLDDWNGPAVVKPAVAEPQIAPSTLLEHLPSFPTEEPPPTPFWKKNIVGVMLIVATGLMLLFMRMSAKSLVGMNDRVESSGGAEADLPYVPDAPKRKEPPPLDLAARAELLARAQKSCTGDDGAACVAAVDALEGQGEPVDPDLSAYRITSLAKIGERSRAIRLGRHFLLRYPDHAARDRVQKALTSIGTPADSAVTRPLPGRPRTKK